MTQKHLITILLWITTIFCATSCLEELKNADSAKITISPQVPLPLVDDEFTLSGFIKSDIKNKFDTSGAIKPKKDSQVGLELYNGIPTLTYKDTLFSNTGTQLFKVEDQNIDFVVPSPMFEGQLPNGTQVPIPTKTIDYKIKTSLSEEFDSISLKTGSLTLQVESNIPANTVFTLSFPAIKTKDGNILRHKFNLNGATATPITKTLDLAKAHLDLTKGGSSFNVLTYSGEGTITGIGQPISNTSITCKIEFNKLDFKTLYGKFITRQTKPFNGEILMDFLDSDELIKSKDKSLRFENPFILLSVHNGFGLPSLLITKNIEVKELITGKTIPLSGPVVEPPTNANILEYPRRKQVGKKASSNLLLNSDNSNIKELFSNMPNKLNYQFNSAIGGLGVHGFVEDNSKITTYVKLNMPLHGRVDNLVLTKHYTQNNLWEGVKKAILKVEAINSIPMDVRIQIYFRDDDLNIIDSLFVDEKNTAKAAPINEMGISKGVSRFSKETLIDNDKMNRLRSLNAMTFSATLATDTSSVSKGIIKVMPHNTIKIKATAHLYIKHTLK